MTERKPKIIKKQDGRKYIALVGFHTSDGKRYEAGQVVDDLTPKDKEALLEMNAITGAK
jgi:hypothetical protein